MKVYVIEVGAYSDRHIDCIFTKQEDAEAYIALKAGMSSYAEVEEWERLHGTWNRHGDIAEYELWDSVPHARAEDLARYQAYIAEHPDRAHVTFDEFEGRR